MPIFSAASWKPMLVPFIREKLPNHRFMQDNDLKHTSRRAQASFEENNINWWCTPPESPDLNPIEDLWHELKFCLESKIKPRNKQELVDGIKKFWVRKVTPEKCAKYIALLHFVTSRNCFSFSMKFQQYLTWHLFCQSPNLRA